MPLFENQTFQLVSPFSPTGDQPQAIHALIQGCLEEKKKSQVLLGVTGSGKTFTLANVIAKLGLPTLVLSHNKTLAAQLFSELKAFFPKNAVEYFVSYYDYYQPEAYIPASNTYIAKDAQINDEIDQLRHSATRSLLERNDVIIVSSVSCIYGLGSPEAYEGLLLPLQVGQNLARIDLLKKLVEMQYHRNEVDFQRGTFRVRGDVVEVFPAYEGERAIRVSFFGDEIEAIEEMDPVRGARLQVLNRIVIYPGSHYVTTLEARKKGMESIREELRERLQELKSLGRELEAERLAQRTLFDLEMIEQLGFCQGIENYSRHFTGRPSGAPPPTLFEYFPKNQWLLVIDESHVTVPQLGAMYRGDQARKKTLVDHGFRLPSALDNRPLSFQEWESGVSQVIYVSATPGNYELEQVKGEVVEQVIRPTGLVDPPVEIRPATASSGSSRVLGQVEDLLQEIHKRVVQKERVLVTVLTKKLAEELSRYYSEKGIRVKYLHSDIETLERVEILRDLRLGNFDVLIGINLLREGLDLPEVSLVAILDADQEGFLRSERSLIQTMGRAARNSEGFVILYADRMTQSMQKACDETSRRRQIQEAYNQAHGMIPKTVQKKIADSMSAGLEMAGSIKGDPAVNRVRRLLRTHEGREERTLWRAAEPEMTEKGSLVDQLSLEMKQAVKDLQFEKAAQLRDRIRQLKAEG